MDNSIYVLIAVWIILPIIPAFILFKFLPSSAEASGPLHGLGMKVGGSFAGFLIIFISLGFWIVNPKVDTIIVENNSLKIQKDSLEKFILRTNSMLKDNEIWTISGNVGSSNRPILHNENPTVELISNSNQISGGFFKLSLVTENKNENRGSPIIILKAKNHYPMNIGNLFGNDLESNQYWKFDKENFIAVLKDTLRLRKRDP